MVVGLAFLWWFVLCGLWLFGFVWFGFTFTILWGFVQVCLPCCVLLFAWTVLHCGFAVLRWFDLVVICDFATFWGVGVCLFYVFCFLYWWRRGNVYYCWYFLLASMIFGVYFVCGLVLVLLYFCFADWWHCWCCLCCFCGALIDLRLLDCFDAYLLRCFDFDVCFCCGF